LMGSRRTVLPHLQPELCCANLGKPVLSLLVFGYVLSWLLLEALRRRPLFRYLVVSVFLTTRTR
jgi:hypothetical protein